MVARNLLLSKLVRKKIIVVEASLWGCFLIEGRSHEEKIVKGVCIYWITFVSLAWITFWIKDSVPDTLIQFGLGGGAVELLITGAIEIFRDFHARKENEL